MSELERRVRAPRKLAGQQSEPGGRPAPAEIRRLVAGDWAELREARLTALQQSPGAFASTLDREVGFDEARWRQALGSAAYFGASQPELGPRLVGLAAGFPEPAAADRDERPAWHLVSMWVSPQLRGSGVAGRLVGAVCDLATAEGAGQVALWVTETNERAQAFYLRAGFRPTGERGLVRPSEPDHWEERMIRVLR